MRLLAEKKGLDNKLTTELLSAKESLQKSPKKHKDNKHEHVTSKTSPKPGSANPGSPTRQVLWNDSTGGMKITTLLKADSVKFPMKPSPMHKFADNLDDSVQLRSTCLISPLFSDEKNEPKQANSAPCTSKPRTSPLHSSASENQGRAGMATRQSPHKSPEPVTKSPPPGKKSASGHSPRHEPYSKVQHKVSPNKESHRRGSHSHVTAAANQQNLGNKLSPCNSASNKLGANVSSGPSKMKNENPSSRHVTANQVIGSKVTHSNSVSTRLTQSALHSARSSHNNSASSCPTTTISTHPQKYLQPSKSCDNIKNKSKKIGSLKELENLLTTSNVKLNLKNLNINKGTPKTKSKNLNNSSTSDGSRSGRKCSNAKSLSSRISLRLRRIRQKSLRNRSKIQTENKGYTKGVKRKMDSSADTPALKKLRHS